MKLLASSDSMYRETLSNTRRLIAAERPLARYNPVMAPSLHNEIIFLVEQDEDGMYNAHAYGHAIFTHGANPDDLRRMVRDAVDCHFDDNDPEKPDIICLRFVSEEVLSL